MTDSDQEQPFVSHLVELRDRLLRALLGVLIVFCLLVPFANDLYQFIALPIIKSLPGEKMLSMEVMGPFLAPLKLTFFAAFALAIPWVLYQVWAFVAPGLYDHEQRFILPLVVSSTILFYLGMAFAYFAILPLFSLFMVATTPEGVEYLPDITRYLNFVLVMFFAAGLAFEVPVATVILVLMGIIETDDLRKQRPYIIVGVFIFAAIITPPDVISQTLLAIPMLILFEIGLIVADFVKKSAKSAEDEPTTNEDGK